jgi:asparagine synthase (glutamine-hydrolysing)
VNGEGVPNPDLQFAADQTRIAGLPHQIFQFGATSFRDLQEAMQELDEPLGVYDSVMSVFHCKAISEHRRVVLSGSGADEVFGGYDSYRVISSCDTARSQSSAALMRVIGTDFRARAAADAEALWVPDLQHMSRQIDWNDDIGWVLDIADVDNMLDAKLLVELLIGMSHCASMFDSAGMASSVEIRSPYLNHKVVEFAAALPPAEKVAAHGPYRTKNLLKRVAERYLPKSVVRRPKTGYSLGFNPIRMIRGPWRGEIDAILQRRASVLASMLDPNKARHTLTALDRPKSTEYEQRRALKLAMFLGWFDSLEL